MISRLPATVATAIALLAGALPAAAAQQFVQDGAGMFSPDTVSSLDSRIGNFNAQTGKEIVVVTVPSLNGSTIQQAAQQAFSQQNVNGVLIYISKGDRRDYFLPGTNEVRSGVFTTGTLDPIRQSMESQFKAGDFDGGITNAVGSVLGVYHSHLNSLPGRSSGTASTGYSRTYAPPAASTGGFHLNMFWLIVLIVVGFLVLRSIFRSMSGPRYMGGPGVGPGGYGPGGGPGWGGGYYGGGGGGFWSGLLGGLGGAWLGNEMFGNRGGGGTYVDPGSGSVVQSGGGDAGGGVWGNDAGQADAGGASGGDWGGGGFGGGDSGGGFGGGDFGGGGGGGGDSGGGW